jgi:hypothetical protein
MAETLPTRVETTKANRVGESAATALRNIDWQRVGILYSRLALGASFLSGIADRFGLYSGRNVGYGNFDGFMQYTAKVNSCGALVNGFRV